MYLSAQQERCSAFVDAWRTRPDYIDSPTTLMSVHFIVSIERPQGAGQNAQRPTAWWGSPRCWRARRRCNDLRGGRVGAAPSVAPCVPGPDGSRSGRP